MTSSEIKAEAMLQAMVLLGAAFVTYKLLRYAFGKYKP